VPSSYRRRTATHPLAVNAIAKVGEGSWLYDRRCIDPAVNDRDDHIDLKGV
jgi:hypothetical protein